MKKGLIALVVLALFSTTLFGQDISSRINTIKNQFEILKIENPGLNESVDINITQTTLSNFLLAISKVHNLNINVSPELNSITIVNNFSNVSVSDIMIFLVKEYNLDIDFTGNILSIRKYIEPAEEVKEKEVLITYSPSNQTVSLDLKNDRLDKVFRKIIDETGKNLLYTPEIEKNPLSIYINNVPFDLALNKLAESNNLIMSITDDGFYIFEGAFVDTGSSSGNVNSRPVRRKRTNFYYKILDTISKRVEVDLKNTPIADVIYTMGEEL
ncbi:MAG: general secretion pathway protein GspD, partial [Flavobacterium sp.]